MTPIKPPTGPVHGQPYAPVADEVKPKERVRARRMAELRGLGTKDIDDYLAALRATTVSDGGTLPGVLAKLTPAGGKAAVAEASADVQRELAKAMLNLVQIYADGRVDEREILPLERVIDRANDLLAMRDGDALAMLPKPVRKRLDLHLFKPIEALTKTATAQSVTLFKRLDKAGREVPAPVAPTQVKASASDGVVLVAGGAETKDVRTAKGTGVEAGLFTCRGPNKAEHGISYKSYNEDAGLAGAVGDVFVAGACDQAGGMGQIPGQTGAASKVAVEELDNAAKAVAAGAKPKDALAEAVTKAHSRINALNFAHDVVSVTTLSGGIIVGDTAHIVNAGDCKVWHLSAGGRLKNETVPHNLGDEMADKSGDPNEGLDVSNIITSCLGSGEPAKVDHYAWKMKPGDFLVFTSDGVCDANLFAQEYAFKKGDPWTRHSGDVTTLHLCALASEAKSAAQLTRAVRDYALAQMKARAGKPDNTTVVVVQYGKA